MPVGEIAGEAVGGVLRLVGRFLFEIIFELLIQGLGYVVIRVFRPGHEPGPGACAVVGLLCWGSLFAGGYFVYRATVA